MKYFGFLNEKAYYTLAAPGHSRTFLIKIGMEYKSHSTSGRPHLTKQHFILSWPHCGATNHCPDRCPFRTYSPQSILGRQGTTYGGQPTSNFTATFPTPQQTLFATQPQPLQVCNDFNFTNCLRPRCKFAHCCK